MKTLNKYIGNVIALAIVIGIFGSIGYMAVKQVDAQVCNSASQVEYSAIHCEEVK